MSMKPKTLDELLILTRKFYKKLEQNLRNSAESSDDELRSYLLEYIADHEKRLTDVVEKFEQESEKNALDTWFYEYTDRHKIIHSDPDDISFENKNAEEVQEVVMRVHNQLLDLYRHLLARAESHTVEETLQQLLDYQKSATEKIAYETGRANEYR